jgi:hypothetical protein
VQNAWPVVLLRRSTRLNGQTKPVGDSLVLRLMPDMKGLYFGQLYTCVIRPFPDDAGDGEDRTE